MNSASCSSSSQNCSKRAIIRQNKIVYNKLKKGDLLEIDRGIFYHWAVYIGNDLVVHLTGDNIDGLAKRERAEKLFTIAGQSYERVKVRTSNLWDVVEGCMFFINNSKDEKWRPYSPDEICEKANACIGPAKYKLYTKNCEHFAKWCRYGAESSDQVKIALWVRDRAKCVIAQVHQMLKFVLIEDLEEDDQQFDYKDSTQKFA